MLGGGPLRAGVLLLSASAIAYEILLIRLLSIIQWQDFAFMVISLALLGYGASGTFLTLARRSRPGPLEGDQRAAAARPPRPAGAFAASSAAFAVAAVACFALAQRIPFNPLAAAWDWRQVFHLLELYLLLAVPFFCAACGIGLALTASGDEVPRVYRADLMGAGAGAVLILLLMLRLPPERCLLVVASGGFLAAGVGCIQPSTRWSRPGSALLLLCALAAPMLWPPGWLTPRLSEYKALSKTLLVPGTAVVAERSGPTALLTVVESPTIPMRHAPGLSLAYPGRLPPQLGLFTDGEGPEAIDLEAGDPQALDYLDYLPSALPFHLLESPRTLVIGAGGGAPVLSALRHGASEVEVIEANPQKVNLLMEDLPPESGGVYRRDGVRVRVAEARSFLAGGGEDFDLVQLSVPGSASGAAAGGQAMHPSYLLTVEGLAALLGRLAPGGMVAVTLGLEVPPRAALKLFATAVAALESGGVEDPGHRLALTRSWSTATLLLKNGRLGSEEVSTLRSFCAERSFDVAWFPGIREEEANRFNLLDEPYLFDGAGALLGPSRRQFLERYKFSIAPASDERPYFFRFSRWRTLPEILRLRARGGAPLMEWGYLLQVATVAQAVAAGLVLILLPLRVVLGRRQGARGSWRVACYFSALGLGFLLVEIWFIQRLTPYLGHPVYAVALSLAVFLVLAGLGSGACRRAGRTGCMRVVSIPAITFGVALLILAGLVAVPALFRGSIHLAAGWKVLIAFAAAAPLAFLMGMPFPLGLAQAARARSDWPPWAWGINGCASVVSATAAPLVAVHLGLGSVALLAAVLYLLAGLVAMGARSPFAGESGYT